MHSMKNGLLKMDGTWIVATVDDENMVKTRFPDVDDVINKAIDEDVKIRKKRKHANSTMIIKIQRNENGEISTFISGETLTRIVMVPKTWIGKTKDMSFMEGDGRLMQIRTVLKKFNEQESRYLSRNSMNDSTAYVIKTIVHDDVTREVMNSFVNFKIREIGRPGTVTSGSIKGIVGNLRSKVVMLEHDGERLVANSMRELTRLIETDRKEEVKNIFNDVYKIASGTGVFLLPILDTIKEIYINGSC